MHNDEQTALTADERRLLSELPRELVPGDLLEERVVRALRKDGHFGGAGKAGYHGLSVAWRVAAALALFAGGVAVGRYAMMPDVPQSASAASPAGSRARDTTPSTSIPAKQAETVVAQREMWL